MLIRQFQSSYYTQYLLLVVLAAGLWINPVLENCELGETGPESPLFNLLSSFFTGGNFLISIIAFVILLFEAFYLNYVLIRHELVAKNSLVTAFVYIILMSQSPQVLTLNPALCAAFFVIPALDLILGTYGKADPTGSVFNAALLLGIASLFNFAFIFLFLVLLISMIVFGTFSIRIFLVALSGFISVYLYLFLYYFLVDDLAGQVEMYLNWFMHFPALDLDFPVFQYAVWFLQDLLFLAAFFVILGRMGEWNISVRKMMLLLVYFALVSLLSFAYILDDIRMGGLVTAIPFTVFMAAFFSNRKKVPYLLELYILIWYVLSLSNNLFLSEC